MKTILTLLFTIVLICPHVAIGDAKEDCRSACALEEPCWGMGVCYKDPGSPLCLCCLKKCLACCDCKDNPETCPDHCDGKLNYGCGVSNKVLPSSS